MFYQDGQTLYFNNAKYNLTLILNELVKIVENEGGKVKPAYHNGYIENRSYYEIANECKTRRLRFQAALEEGKVTEPEKVEKLKAAIEKWKEEEEENEKAGEESKRAVAHEGYIRFTLNGYCYYFQMPENVFSYEDIRAIKTKIINNQYSKDAASDEIPRGWLWDCFYSISDQKPEIEEDRKEAANIIFNELVKMPESKKIIDTHKKRVPNTYNNGYHYEIVRDKERLEKIDF